MAFDTAVSMFQLVAISVGVVSVAVGIGIPVFYETQIDNAVSSVTDIWWSGRHAVVLKLFCCICRLSGRIRSLASRVTDPVLVRPHILSLEIDEVMRRDDLVSRFNLHQLPFLFVLLLIIWKTNEKIEGNFVKLRRQFEDCQVNFVMLALGD